MIMYGLPANFDGSIFVGRFLEQICFTENQVALHFDDAISIVIGSSFSYETSQPQSTIILAKMPLVESNLMQLLGFAVAKAFGDKDGTLTLRFENNHIFKCFDDSCQYESYAIYHNGEEIIV
jgi:hypothetical protein